MQPVESKALAGLHLIVTGAASGIGQRLAIRAAQAGARVTCVDLQDCEDTTAQEIRSLGGSTMTKKMDIRSSGEWKSLVESAETQFGPVNLLANVAGIVNRRGPDTVCELREEDWHEMIDTNLTGTWLGMRSVIPSMIKFGGGRILNISSMAAIRGRANLAAYSAAKGGVAALTRQAAVEYASNNVLVNSIAPGTVLTPILEGTTKAMQEEAAAAHAIKRLGRPDDIVAMALHFFSPDSGAWLTGQVMPVDGGWHVT